MLSAFIGILLCPIPSAAFVRSHSATHPRLLDMAATVAANDWKASCVACGELMCQKDTYAKTCKATVLRCEKVQPPPSKKKSKSHAFVKQMLTPMFAAICLHNDIQNKARSINIAFQHRFYFRSPVCIHLTLQMHANDLAQIRCSYKCL